MIRRRKDPWQKLASSLYVPPLLRFAGGYPNACCCPLPCAPCIGGNTPKFMYVRFHGITSYEPHYPPYTGPDTNDDWNETWWQLKQLPTEGYGCRYRASTKDPCDDGFGIVHTQPFPVVCGPNYDNYFLDLRILDPSGWGILTIGTCGTWDDSGFHAKFSEPLGELNGDGELDCMNIDVNWTQEHTMGGFSMFCANWGLWSDSPDIDIKSPPDPR